jgi:hypothetical protein
MTHQEFMKKWLPEMPQRKQEKFLADFAEMLKPPENTIWVESVISHRDTRPVVSVRIGDYSFQVSPDDARKIGRDFYEVAGGAEMDAVMFQYLTGQVGLEPEKAFAAIMHLRKWRDDRQRLNAEPSAGGKQ